MTSTVSLVNLCLKQKRIHRSYSTFSRLVSLVEQRNDKSLGDRGVYPKKILLNGFARTGKTAQNESGGATCPSCLLAAPLMVCSLSSCLKLTVDSSDDRVVRAFSGQTNDFKIGIHSSLLDAQRMKEQCRNKAKRASD